MRLSFMSILRGSPANCWRVLRGIWATVQRAVLISLSVCTVTSAYLLLVWAVLSSPSGWKLISAISLSLSLFTFGLIVTAWLFVLAKHFSTHQVKVMDLGRMARKQAPPGGTVAAFTPPKPRTNQATYGDPAGADGAELAEDEDGVKIDRWARDIADNLLKPAGKEKLTNSLF